MERRFQYWDYLRQGIQFFSLQNRLIQKQIEEKDQDIIKLAEKYNEEKQKTQDMYQYLALLEKPLEEKLEKIMNYRKVLNLLN